MGLSRSWQRQGRGLEELVSRACPQPSEVIPGSSSAEAVCTWLWVCVCHKTGLRCGAAVASVSDWCNGYAISVLVFKTQTSKDLRSVWRGFYNEPCEALLIRRALCYRIAFWC